MDSAFYAWVNGQKVGYSENPRTPAEFNITKCVNASEIAEGYWEVKAEGRTLASGRPPELDVAPRQEREFALALPALRPEAGVEYWLDLRFLTRRELSWAPKGHEPAWEQFKLPVSAPARRADPAARVSIRAKLPVAGAAYSLTYTVYGSGDIVAEASYQPGEGRAPMMPRFGMEWVAAPGLERITWYGRGPAATYWDRNFERMGVYSSTVDKEWMEYSRPQEDGNKTEVR